MLQENIERVPLIDDPAGLCSAPLSGASTVPLATQVVASGELAALGWEEQLH